MSTSSCRLRGLPFCIAVWSLTAFAQDAGTSLVPPQAQHAVEAEYPAEALEARATSRVELLVTVRPDGAPGEVEIALSGGAAFNEAALTAVRQWQFSPALRDGEPIAARIRVPFEFAPPPLPPAIVPEVDAGVEEEAVIEVTVQGERELRAEERSTSDFTVSRDVLNAAPRQEGAEVLRAAPGVYIGRGEGAAVAHNYMLRGFDADHGQDIEFRVAGLPINLPSHIHGQGYADLNFLISDVVDELHVSEGIYDPRQGDFAVAGSINVSLGVAENERGVRLKSSYGAFNTFRQLVRWAPRDAPKETFGAAQYWRTDGFGENRSGQGGSGLFQHRFGEGAVTFRAVGLLHAARSSSAGVVREDDVERGTVDFHGVYPYPTARAQNALAMRFLTGLFADYAGSDGANGQVGVWLGYDTFRSQANFTGFIAQSRTLERTAGRGDLIEQQNRTFSFGLTGRYRTSPFRPAEWAHGTLEIGVDGRMDVIDQAQNLLDATTRNQTWDRRVDAGIRGLDLGVWGDLDWSFTQYLRVRAGLRADVLSYEIEDRLGNFAPLTRPQDSFIQGFRRSALGLAVGPRTSVEVRPVSWLKLLAAYGEGYRSPQARMLEDGEAAPFSRVRSADVGARFESGEKFKATVGGYYTQLSDDVAFHAEEGRLERIGATQRLGAVAHVVARPFNWLVGSASVTFVHATLLEPPPPTAEEPQPPFVTGQQLPFVPPLVVRADIGARHTFIDRLGPWAFGGRAGIGFSLLSPRPLPYGEFAATVALLDGSVAVSWGPLELSFELFNALNSRYAAVEYAFPSDWSPNDGVRPRTPARHLAAGSPLSWTLSLGVTL